MIIKLTKQDIKVILYFLEKVDIDGLGINSTYDWYALRLNKVLDKLKKMRRE